MSKSAKKKPAAKKTQASAKVAASKVNQKSRSNKSAQVKTKVEAVQAQLNKRPMLTWLIVMLLVGGGLIAQIKLTSVPAVLYIGPKPIPPAGVKLHVQLKQLLANIQAIEDHEDSHELKVIDQATLDREVQVAKINLAAHRWVDAKNDLTKLSRKVSQWQNQLIQATSKLQFSLGINITNPPNGRFIPILLYHNLPADFEEQLWYLRDHGYTSVSLDEVADGLAGRINLPLKPVVMTFDDGYSDQWQAYKLLKKYQMKATYYIIIDRADSGCGARTKNCDSAYLGWDQIKQIDDEGLVTIGDHTVTHPELPKLTRTEQISEISSARSRLSKELGHSIGHLAYPYGQYNDVTLSIVRQAGFRTAVTTEPGFFQSPSDSLKLHRVRNALLLP